MRVKDISKCWYPQGLGGESLQIPTFDSIPLNPCPLNPRQLVN